MTAGLRHRLEHVRPQLVGELAELLALERAQLRRIVDALQQLVHRRIVVAGRQLAGDRAHAQNFLRTMKSASSARRRARGLKSASAACACERSSCASALARAMPSAET